MAVPVSFFNANILDVTGQVNNGAQFTITGASAPNYTPQVPASGGPTWNNAGPAVNALGPGTNTIVITPTGSVTPFLFTAVLPATIQWVSVQFYAFWNTNTQVNWIVLNNGAYVTGSLTLMQPAQAGAKFEQGPYKSK